MIDNREQFAARLDLLRRRIATLNPDSWAGTFHTNLYQHLLKRWEQDVAPSSANLNTVSRWGIA